MNTQQYFIIDFDSTFIMHEGLELLAQISLKAHPKRDEILKEISSITKLGMEGKLPFSTSLAKRVAVIEADKTHVEKLVRLLQRKITPSIGRNKAFFRKHRNEIYIISGGFKEFIVPIVKQFGITDDHIFANTFTYSTTGSITGFDKKNILAQENGKTKAVKSLKLSGEIFVIGDGYTDFQIKKAGIATKFIAFTENIARAAVLQNADHIAPTFDEFLFTNKLPMNLSYPKNRIQVMLLEHIEQTAVRIFEKEGLHVTYYEKSLSTEELKKKMRTVHIVGIRSRTQLDQHVLSTAQRLLVIGAFCIGTDQISLSHASQKGVAVFNAPYSNTRSVVELVIGEIIMLMRKITDKSTALHTGTWDKSAIGSNEIRGKTLGIIGYGNIGSQLSVVAEALGMKVVFFDTVEKLALGNAYRASSMAAVLKQADVITIHVDGSPQNYNLIGGNEFRMMKQDAIFLNLARGKVVDLSALARALRSGKLRGAAIDVFPKEPKGKDERLVTPLQRLPNVILTPHIGGSTLEAQKNIAEYVSGKIIDFVNTGNTFLSVNLPNVQLAKNKKVHRLLHLHKNVPGVLAQINSTLATHGINIESQHLKTTDQVGYVITDVNKKYDKAVLTDLKLIPDTIRFRVLY